MKRAQDDSLPDRSRLFSLFLLASALTSLWNAESSAAVPDHAFVSGYQRFFTSETTDAAAGGMLLLGELNCVSCHRVGAAAKQVASKQAPLLGDVASRASVESIRRFITSPHATKSGTTMPDVLAGMAEKDRAVAAGALTHFLVSLASNEFAHSRSRPGAKSRGETLFHTVGCVACHAPRNKSGAKLLATSVPLGNLKSKYSLDSLTRFLRDPLAVRPAGRMPSTSLSEAEASDVAAYLTDAAELPAQLTYSYYEGTWANASDMAKSKPKSTGQATGFKTTGFPRTEYFGLMWQAHLAIDQAGQYTFYTDSDDGSMLYIGNKLVVNNDGVHGNELKSGRIQLAAGRHPIRVMFFNQGGPFGLTVEYEGPGIKRQQIPFDRLVGAKDETPLPLVKKLAVDPKLVEKGRRLFASTGCASCHQLGGKHKAVASKLSAPSLERLNVAGGCLSERSAAGRPTYHLSARQKVSIAAAIAALKRGQLKPPISGDEIRRTLTSLNCYACHERDGVGGVEPSRDALFTSNGDDLGPEGRLPPPLTGVGDKLKADWLDEVLVGAGNARSYINVRMPQFGKSNVGHLAAVLAKLDQKALDQKASSPNKVKLPTDVAKKAGHELVGKTGLSCISCHSFHRFKSTGIQATDLTLMTRRLRKEWFRRYMLDPQAFRPGTRMPQSWPNGKSFKPTILAGNTNQQISAVYDYLSDGRKARLPAGLVTNSMELIADYEAVMYRNFIAGAGPRAIAVGLPSQVNFAFDAQNLRLALIWQGRFMNASRHWNGRGSGFQAPLGDKVVSLVGGAPFAVLQSETSQWPTEVGKAAGYRFRGYRLDKLRRPALMYDFGDIRVNDYSAGKEFKGGLALVRTFTLTSSKDVKNLWYRAAAGGKIERVDDTTYRINGQWVMQFTLEGGAKPLLRSKNGPELLVPVVLRGGKAKFVQEYRW